MRPKHAATPTLSENLEQVTFKQGRENRIFLIGAVLLTFAIPVLMLGLPKGYTVPKGFVGGLGVGMLTGGYTGVAIGVLMELLILPSVRWVEAKRTARRDRRMNRIEQEEPAEN